MALTVNLAPESMRFAGHNRGRNTIDRIVMHEPAVATLADTIKTLQAKGLSVHYTIDRDGAVMQHCPEERACAHAGIPGVTTGHNSRSIGLEFINRYYGHRVSQTKDLRLYVGEYAPTLISGSWVDRAWSATEKRFLNPDRLYIMPTQQQLEAGWLLIEQLLERYPVIKAAGWTGVSKTLTMKAVYTWGTVRGHDSAGVKAHAQWNHADGRVPSFYTLLRSRGLNPVEAFAQTLQGAASMAAQTVLPPKQLAVF